MRRLLGPPAVVWRQLIRTTTPRERALRLRLEKEFRRTLAHAADQLRQGADEPNLVAHDSRVLALLVAAYNEGMPVYARPVLSAGGKAAPVVVPRKCEAVVRGWIENVALRKAKQVAGTTRAQLRNVIARARADGLGTSGIASRIRDEASLISRARALTIARTETHSAANAAQLFAAESLEREGMQREWIAAGDERTREDHAEADGQLVGLEQPFEVGGVLLMYPGDAGGPPEQIINCRCTTGFMIPD